MKTIVDNFKEPPNGKDVIMTTRWYIADLRANVPMMFLPAARVCLLPPWGQLGWGHCARNAYPYLCFRTFSNRYRSYFPPKDFKIELFVLMGVGGLMWCPLEA